MLLENFFSFGFSNTVTTATRKGTKMFKTSLSTQLNDTNKNTSLHINVQIYV